MDKIIIDGLEVYAYHGVAPEEKELGQMFVISVEVSLDLETAACKDSINHTVHYGHLCEDIKKILLSHKFDLIEAAALSVVNGILGKYPPVAAVKVLLKKPWAPLRQHLRYVAVEMERRRDNENVR